VAPVVSAEHLTTALVALFGAAVGSFLNVCILRLPARRSIVRPGSRCPKCERPLRWYENIPVVSWVALRARCAGCGQRVALMYPLVELATAATFVAAWRAFGPTPLLAARLVFLSALIVLAVTDIRERLLPNAITLPGIALGLVFSLIAPPGLSSALLGAVLGGLVPFLVGEVYYRVRGIEGLGMGDVKMLAMIGAFLGAPLALLTLFTASVLGVIVGVPLIILTRNRHYPVPLGTLLAASAFAAAFAGESVVGWYTGLYW
jgi:leader peptidase (prepilin peptidase) / N-methyltransferase